MSELGKWFASLGKNFSSYQNVCEENGIKDLVVFGDLDVNDLVTDLGIKKTHAKVICRAWQRDFGSAQSLNLTPSVVKITGKSLAQQAAAKDHEKVDTIKVKKLERIFRDADVFKEVLNYADYDSVVGKTLSIIQEQEGYIFKLQSNPPATKHRGFLSHVQKDSADLCRSLFYALKEKRTSV